MLGYVRFFTITYGNVLSAFLIAAMTLSKLLLVQYPLRTRSWTISATHKVCLGNWLAALVVPFLILYGDRDGVVFDYRVYYGYYNGYDNSSIGKILVPIIAVLTILAPYAIILISTVLLLREAMKVVRARGNQERLRWQGIITVVLNAAVYTLSFLPMIIYFATEPLIEKDPMPRHFFVEFYRVATSALSFNLLANFFVYSLTVSSFRSFLKSTFRQKYLFLSSNVNSAGDVSKPALSHKKIRSNAFGLTILYLKSNNLYFNTSNLVSPKRQRDRVTTVKL